MEYQQIMSSQSAPIDLSSLTPNEDGVVSITIEQLEELQKQASVSEETGLRNKAHNAAKKALSIRHADEYKKLYEAACAQVSVDPWSSKSRASGVTIDLTSVKA